MGRDPVPVKDLLRYLGDLGWRDVEVAAASHGPRESGAPAEPADCPDLPCLERLIDGCTRCTLAKGRNSIVFGEGDPHARLMFVGEGPGKEEDSTGRPFVGQAGKLLDAMIQAMGLGREEVYIANVVKCRPPKNRDPRDDEVAACAPFLDRQIELIEPEVIVCLGKPAAHRLLGTKRALKALRGQWFTYKGAAVLVTYHPAYLLRTPRDKRLVWEDLKRVMERLGLPR